MTRSATFGIGMLAVLTGLAGCSVDEDARRLVAKAPSGGLAETFYPSAEKLLKAGRIDHHVVIEGVDNTPMDVWVIDARSPDGSKVAPRATMLLLHSRDENKSSFPTFGAAERLARKGFDVVLPDLRAHGRSGGQYITYGVKEGDDLKAVMDKLAADGLVEQPVYAFGRNYSGMVALHCAAADPRVKGVLAVAPYSDFVGIARFWHQLTPSDRFGEIVEEAAAVADFTPAETNTAQAAEQTDAAIVLVHGVLDASAPRSHTEMIYKSASQPKRMVVPVAGEALAMGIMEDWIANSMAKLATEGVSAFGQAAAADDDGDGE